jgi:hypothetical protein
VKAAASLPGAAPAAVIARAGQLDELTSPPPDGPHPSSAKAPDLWSPLGRAPMELTGYFPYPATTTWPST